MLFLHAGSLERLQRFKHKNLGRLVQPRDCTRLKDTLVAGFKVGVDNDAYTHGVNLPRFYELVESMRATVTDLLASGASEAAANLLWVVVPDVPGDAHATRANFEVMNNSLIDLPVAFAVQPGVARAGIPFDAPNLRCLFLAGPRWFKESEEMAAIAASGKERGLWLHGAPCNSMERAELLAALGCDSFDGTGASRYPALIPRYLAWSELAGLALRSPAVKGDV